MKKSALIFSLFSVISVTGCQSLMGPSEEMPLAVEGYEIVVSTEKAIESSQAFKQVFLYDGYKQIEKLGRMGENDKVKATSIYHQGSSEIILKESVYLETDLSNKHSETYRKVRFRAECQELEKKTVCRAKTTSAHSASHFLTKKELAEWNEVDSLRSIVNPNFGHNIVTNVN